jgi:hypothetical protein
MTFTDTNLKASTPYRYRLRALGKNQTVSAYSKIAGAMTLPPAATPAATSTRKPIPAPTPNPTRSRRTLQPRGHLVAPIKLTASAVSTSQINLTWTSNSNNATGLYVERSLSATGPWQRVVTLPANSTSCGNASLSESTTYYYRVVAYNSEANSDYSNVASATTLTMLPRGGPSNLAARTQAPTQIGLSWTNNAGDATGFKIESCQGSGCSSFKEIATTAADATSYKNTSLSPLTSYSYRVRAYNGKANSGYSNVATANTARDNNPPAAPMGVTAVAVSFSKISLSWNPAREGGSGVGGYNVYQNGERIGSTAVTNYSIIGLAANTQYCYTVTAYDKGGNGSTQSDPACATTKPAPKPEDPLLNER